MPPFNDASTVYVSVIGLGSRSMSSLLIQLPRSVTKARIQLVLVKGAKRISRLCESASAPVTINPLCFFHSVFGICSRRIASVGDWLM